jgi:hypothetical protein
MLCAFLVQSALYSARHPGYRFVHNQFIAYGKGQGENNQLGKWFFSVFPEEENNADKDCDQNV